MKVTHFGQVFPHTIGKEQGVIHNLHKESLVANLPLDWGTCRELHGINQSNLSKEH